MDIADIDVVTAEATAGSTDALAAIVVVVVVAFDIDEEAETPCVLAGAATDIDGKVKVEPFCAPRLATFFGRGEVEEEEGEVMASESMAMTVVAAVG